MGDHHIENPPPPPTDTPNGNNGGTLPALPPTVPIGQSFNSLPVDLSGKAPATDNSKPDKSHADIQPLPWQPWMGQPGTNPTAAQPGNTSVGQDGRIAAVPLVAGSVSPGLNPMQPIVLEPPTAIPDPPGLPGMPGFPEIPGMPANPGLPGLAGQSAAAAEANAARTAAAAAETAVGSAAAEASAATPILESIARVAAAAAEAVAAVPAAAAGAILLYPNQTAEAWRDTINPNTREPYTSAAEYAAVQAALHQASQSQPERPPMQDPTPAVPVSDPGSRQRQEAPGDRHAPPATAPGERSEPVVAPGSQNAADHLSTVAIGAIDGMRRVNLPADTAGTGGIISISGGRIAIDNSLVVQIEGRILDSINPRSTAPNFNSRLPSADDIGLAGYQILHLWGPGWGDEAWAGLMYGPAKLNLTWQNSGIEDRIRQFYDIAAPNGIEVRVVARAHAFPPGTWGGHDILSEVSYQISLYHPARGHTQVGHVTLSVDRPPHGTVHPPVIYWRNP